MANFPLGGDYRLRKRRNGVWRANVVGNAEKTTVKTSNSRIMAWNYQKRIKVIPGVHLNISKSGISTTIGPRGASVTFGKSGTSLNTSVQTLGINNRQKLSSLNPIDTSEQHLEFAQPIFSVDVQEITSQNMQGVKEAIIIANNQRKELMGDLLKIEASNASSKLKLKFSYVLLYGFIWKSIPQRIKEDIKSQEEAIIKTKEQIERSFVKLEIDLDPEINEKYFVLVEAFKNLAHSQRIWDVTSAHYQNTALTRSSAGTLVKKLPVKFSLKSLADIKSDFEALYFQNANGADLYLYPSFIIMYSSKTDFAIIGIDEIILSQTYVRFVETGTIPKDAKVIDKTWAKVNKNGTPDRRFKGNYQIPVVKYGELTLRTATGLNEEYQFSNYESTEEFGRAFREYQQLLKSLKPL